MTVNRLAVEMKTNRVPKNGRYFLGLRRPTSPICFSIDVTTISKRLCHRLGCKFVESFLVTSKDPRTKTNIIAQLNTIVPFSLKIPCCQKISPSALRRMGGLSSFVTVRFFPRPGEPHHSLPSQKKTE